MHIVRGIKKAASICMAAVICLSVFGMRSYALTDWAEDCYVASEGACLMDAGTGTVLYSKDADAPYYPASITKVMTALIVLENCDNLNEMVTFSYEAVHIEEENSTIIGASEGDRLSVLDCLYCLLFQSANEVANALAEHVGAKYPNLKTADMSDRDVFIELMNRKADELGCRGSHFNNPSGLTDPDHYVTAYDMCLIMAAAIDNETFLDIESHTYWTHAPIARYPDADDPWNTVYPKHSMLKRNNALYYKDAIAGKTGYTLSAGNTLVTAAERDGMRLVVCVLNAHANHYNDTARLLDFGFDNFISLKVSDYDDLESAIQDDFSISGIPLISSYIVGVDPEARIIIPRTGTFAEVGRELSIEYSSDGEGASAVLNYTYGDRTVGSAHMKLTAIGDNRDMLSYAEEDPLLAGVLGIPAPGGTEAAAPGEDGTGTEEEESAAETEPVRETALAEESTDDSYRPTVVTDGSEAEDADSGGGSLGRPAIAAGLIAIAAAAVIYIRIMKRKRARQRKRILDRRRRYTSIYSRDDDYQDISSKIKKK